MSEEEEEMDVPMVIKKPYLDLNWNVKNNLFKVLKTVNVVTKTGHFVRLCREFYLRDTIACNSALCSTCTIACTSILPADCDTYVMPDLDTVMNYFEIFEMYKFRGFIYLQSICQQYGQLMGSRAWRRFKQLIGKVDRQCTQFLNIFYKRTHVPKSADESLLQWHRRLVDEAAKFYTEHLPGIRLIILSDWYKNDSQARWDTLSLLDYVKLYHKDKPSLIIQIEEIGKSLKPAHLHGNVLQHRCSVTYEPYWSDIERSGSKGDRFIQGKLMVSKRCPNNVAYVCCSFDSDWTEGTEVEEPMVTVSDQSDVLIEGMRNRNRAVHGDLVIVKILENSKIASDVSDDVTCSRSSGIVVSVVQRHWRPYVCTVMTGSGCLAVPYDRRIPKIQLVQDSLLSSTGQRVLVSIVDWPIDSAHPIGRILKVIGPVGELETEMRCILYEHQLPVESPANVQLTQTDTLHLNGRLDLRHSHLVFSIDPSGCTDVDDALSVRVLDEQAGNLELGVHIADVSYFVSANSAIDLEAAERGTSVYLADRRIDMLPACLASDQCSLLSGIDRYAVSLFWELEPVTLNVVDFHYSRSVIRSRYKLEYGVAQQLFDGTLSDVQLIRASIAELANLDDGQLTIAVEDLKRSLAHLVTISAHLYNSRCGLALESSEVSIKVENAVSVTDVTSKTSLLMEDVIAECMIWANHWVARENYKRLPLKALLRRHPPPLEQKLQKLTTLAKTAGLLVDSSSNVALAKSLENCQHTTGNAKRTLKQLAVFSMERAEYFCTGSSDFPFCSHYGLNLDYYTHFTSPIRRYADIVVHRQLLGDESATAVACVSKLADICLTVNSKNRAAQNAQRDSQRYFVALHLTQQLKNRGKLLLEAVVVGFSGDGLKVIDVLYGIVGFCFLRNNEGRVCFVGENGQVEWLPGSVDRGEGALAVDCEKGKHWYRLFDTVLVDITVQQSECHMPDFRFTLAGLAKPKDEDEEIVVEKNLGQFCRTQLPEQLIESMTEISFVDQADRVDCSSDLEQRKEKKIPNTNIPAAAAAAANITTTTKTTSSYRLRREIQSQLLRRK
ncbi:DIS3-like exonuclease 1 [Trichinella spiralis]|uniref:DIS3-like exonuclease 1 n=1 Tax=Trichinella spiralis TaxID=6334 RepID=A0A0V1ATB6_TRISP|nr:DIS3-like exonuclease 1 [Trichinella spiralis]